MKSYSRLGYAQIQLADYKGAVDSYRRGLEVDSSNAACIEGLAEAEKLLDDEASSSMDATELDDTTASVGREPTRFCQCLLYPFFKKIESIIDVILSISFLS